MCGEKRKDRLDYYVPQGSPPRVRGKGHAPVNTNGCSGITPACAGKRMCYNIIRNQKGDHPRVCGEKAGKPQRTGHRSGSPPRVRGKALRGVPQQMQRGITPACAGKSRMNGFQEVNSRDHPRVCGEKLPTVEHFQRIAGSPPRVRGKAALSASAAGSEGITPACAGKRLKRSHSIGHFSCILCLFHSVLHRASVSGGSRAGPCAPPCLPAQNAVPV